MKKTELKGLFENFQKIKGYFKIESIDKNGNVIDSFENHNIVVDTARVVFAKLISGISTQNVINKLVLGTQGHIGNDILTPKTEKEGFDHTKTDLFCLRDPDKKGDTWNEITFTPSGNMAITSASDVRDGTNDHSTVDIQLRGLDISEPCISYIFNISADAFNGSGNGVIYTEAGLFSDDNLIATRVFKGKVKDQTVSFRITWNLIF